MAAYDLLIKLVKEYYCELGYNDLFIDKYFSKCEEVLNLIKQSLTLNEVKSPLLLNIAVLFIFNTCSNNSLTLSGISSIP